MRTTFESLSAGVEEFGIENGGLEGGEGEQQRSEAVSDSVVQGP